MDGGVYLLAVHSRAMFAFLCVCVATHCLHACLHEDRAPRTYI